MAQVVNTTTQLTAEMKTFYDKDLIRNAKPALVHNQFGQKRNIPKNGGKIIEFRKFSPLAKATTALTEGVTPDGKKLTVTAITATVGQYGDYVALSDVLQLTSIDNTLLEANRLLGAQAGETLDALTANILAAGTNVQYAGGHKARAEVTKDDVMTVEEIKKAVRTLKNNNAGKIGGSYVGIIHPDVAYDLTNDPKWEAVKTYDPKDWYNGEIGRICGVRFVETTEAVKFATGGGTSGAAVYATLIIGADAYGVTTVEGGGLKTIIKQLGSGGSADPLDQRSSAGWKALHTAKILVEEFMVRIESCATASPGTE